MKKEYSLANAEVQVCLNSPQITIAKLRTPQRCLSWAPWNGGMVNQINYVVNRTLHKDEWFPESPDDRDLWFIQGLQKYGLNPIKTVELLTAVPQEAIAPGDACDPATGLEVDALCTVGLGNAMAPGDPALYNEELKIGSTTQGTINLIVMLNRKLEECAYHELMSVITLTKSDIMFQRAKKNRFGKTCLGTGTDCIALLAPMEHEVTLRYAGLHTKLAEITAKAVESALKKAILIHHFKSSQISIQPR